MRMINLLNQQAKQRNISRQKIWFVVFSLSALAGLVAGIRSGVLAEAGQGTVGKIGVVPESSGTNADDRLALASPGRVTTPASSCPGIDGVRSRPRRSVQVDGHA